MKRLDNCIPVDQLQIGAVYKIKARNMTVGMWNGREFYGRREKFGDTFIDKEIHWDLDDHYGTAQPIELLVDADGIGYIF